MRNAHRQAERDLSGERERLKETVRLATQAANEAAREVARRAQEASRQVAEAARAAGMEAAEAARAIGRQATGSLAAAGATAQETAVPDAALDATETGAAAPAATEGTPSSQTPHQPVSPTGSGAAGAPTSQRAIAPAGTRWVTAELLAGDIDVYAVAGLTGPEIEGSGEISAVETDYGFLIKLAPERGGILDRFLARVRSSDITVKIPADYGLNLRATAGDVDLHGVKYLQGRITAGDVRARGLEGIDFTTMAGDVDMELRLKEGEHSLICATGDLDVVLSPDSDVSIDGSVSIGDAHSSHPAIRTERHTLGERLTGTLGSGAARLSLRVTTGELAVKVKDQNGSG